jgi:hypothetical protein
LLAVLEAGKLTAMALAELVSSDKLFLVHTWNLLILSSHGKKGRTLIFLDLIRH